MSEKDGLAERQADGVSRERLPEPTVQRTSTNLGLPTRSDGRGYKCPNCDGEFDSWDSTMKNRSRGMADVCPFCGLERHEYEGGES
jgi:predicted RNA-binding Zn-ribbon protein involved in translation (DUF1610 family)